MPRSLLDDEKLIAVATETFRDRPFCIVRRWMLIDVMLSARNEKAVSERGLATRVLFASTVVYAEPEGLPAAKGILSGFQRQFEDCFFETDDMLYILAGQGSQRYASAPAVESVAKWLGTDNWQDMLGT